MIDQRYHGMIKGAVDYLGLVAFLAVYFMTRDMLQATWAIVIGSVIGLVVGLVLLKKIAPIPLLGAASGIVFGGLSIFFKDAIFIKLKLTIIDGLFCVILLGGLTANRYPLKALLGGAINLSDADWKRLSLNYGIFFGLLAIINLVIVYTQPEAVWVAFRFPGVPILAVLFSLTQLPIMLRTQNPEKEGT